MHTITKAIVTALLTGIVVMGAIIFLFGGRNQVNERAMGPVANITLEESSDDEIYQCTTDEDCITVNNGCCGCGSGGSVVTINKEYEMYWTSVELDGCSSVMCAAVMSKDISCFSEPRCVSNRCTLVEPSDSKKRQLRADHLID